MKFQGELDENVLFSFTTGILSIGPYIGCPVSLAHCLVYNVCTVLYIALFSAWSLGGTNAGVELQTVFGYKVVISIVQNILILFFLDHNLKKNPKSKNSFRTCESQFEKMKTEYPFIHQVGQLYVYQKQSQHSLLLCDISK